MRRKPVWKFSSSFSTQMSVVSGVWARTGDFEGDMGLYHSSPSFEPIKCDS